MRAGGPLRTRSPGELLLLELHVNDPDELARLLTSGSAPFLERATRFWESHVRAAQDTGEVRTDVDPAEAAEWIARCLYSLAATRRSRSTAVILRPWNDMSAPSSSALSGLAQNIT